MNNNLYKNITMPTFLLALFIPLVIFIFTIGRYYGFYYDNHYFNLLALDLMDGFRPWLYLGSHYTIHSALYSWLVLPLFYIFGPTDFSMELLSAVFHLGTVLLCFKLGDRFFKRSIGLIAAFLVGIAPIYLINIYTWPEYSLIAFLNLASIYYFLAGFQEGARSKIILSSVLFCLSCSQSIYSVALLPVYLIYAASQINADVVATRPSSETKGSGKQSRWIASSSRLSSGLLAMTLRAIRYLFVITALAYFIALIEAMYIESAYRFIYYAAILMSVFAGGFVFNKFPAQAKEALNFSCLFFIITATVLLLADLFIQLDMNFFAQKFGYYRDSTFAGGFGIARPPFVFKGAPLAILGRPVYLSVLSSLLAFAPGYSRISFSLSDSSGTMLSYYQKCFPPPINLFFIIGIIGLSADILYKKYNRQLLNSGHVFALTWLAGITLTFFNTFPYHILRIYILPMPYFMAPLGVYYFSKTIQAIFKGRRNIFELTVFILVLLLTYKQLIFLKDNVYNKYKYDKSRSNYFHLFYGWPYGRSYKEVGEFLLRNAPLKEGNRFRSIFVYTIAFDVASDTCAILYNTIDWYTQNKIKVIYDIKPISIVKYGSRAALARYLNQLFSENPDVQAIYFGDFFDRVDNFSFFAKAHPYIKPYKIVNDDDNLAYDCVLYKFERNLWREQLG